MSLSSSEKALNSSKMLCRALLLMGVIGWNRLIKNLGWERGGQEAEKGVKGDAVIFSKTVGCDL